MICPGRQKPSRRHWGVVKKTVTPLENLHPQNEILTTHLVSINFRGLHKV